MTEDPFSDAREEGRRKLAQAGIYCRMSLASMGDTTKVDDQERICRELAARLGWPVAGVYCDNNKSAWQKNRKRKDWERLFADIEAGRINAVIIYHGDRFIRQPFDLERLILIADGRGVRLAAPTGMRDFDNPDDRYIMRIEAAGHCRESDSTSRRRKAQYERWRIAGRVRPGGRGGRAFGFATDGVTLIPAETALIVSAAELILKGQPTSQVAAWLNSKGALTPAGAPFTHGTVRKMLARPRYAGLMPDGVSTAAWDPVLDRETWEQVRSVLEARAAGFGYATNARRYLLSGIAKCSECETGLQVRTEHRPELTGYGCVQPGCRKVQRNARKLDAYVIAAVVARLALEGNPAGQLPEAPGLVAEFRALSEQRAELEAAISDHAQGRLSLLLARLDSLDARLAQLRELAGDSARARLRREHAGITEAEFRDLTLGVQRSLVSACVTVAVRPASRRGPGFRTEDVDLSAQA